MSIETERKFLVAGEAWRALATAGRRIVQGYLAVTPSCNVRVRTTGGQAFLTVKGRRRHDTREEYEYPIPVADAEAMLARMRATALVTKTRYDVPIGAHVVEVDEFSGDNRGLVLAEIERGRGGSWPARLPGWLGREVTGDERYYNAHLARLPYARWAPDAPDRDAPTSEER